MRRFLAIFIVMAMITTVITVFAVNYKTETANFPILIDGEVWKTDSPVITVDDRTYLPLRALGEALGVGVDWNEDKKQVEITTQTTQPTKPEQSDMKDYHYSGDTVDDPIDVSLINLIATPERFDGKYVMVIGVGNLEFEGNALYLSKDDLKYGNTKNSVWLANFTNYQKEYEDYNGKIVIVEGRFNMNNDGHMWMNSGAIEDITRYEDWEALMEDAQRLLESYGGSLSPSKN